MLSSPDVSRPLPAARCARCARCPAALCCTSRLAATCSLPRLACPGLPLESGDFSGVEKLEASASASASAGRVSAPTRGSSATLVSSPPGGGGGGGGGGSAYGVGAGRRRRVLVLSQPLNSAVLRLEGSRPFRVPLATSGAMALSATDTR